MASLGSGGNLTDLGNIRSETNGRESNLFIQAIPLSSSDKALTLDLFGTTRDINISGTVTGNTATLQTFITDMEAKQVPPQSSIVFVSSLHPTNINVKVNSFKWTYTDQAVQMLNYTLLLIEG